MREDHDYEATVVAPTYESGGYTRYQCKVCEYFYDGDRTNKLKHHYSDEYEHDDEFHWHPCTDEGYEDLRDGEAEHVYGDWIVDEEATITEGGHQHRVCQTCEYVQEADTDPIPHEHEVANWVYSDLFVPSVDDDNNTFFTSARHGECSLCGEDVVEELNFGDDDGEILDRAIYLSSVNIAGSEAFSYFLDTGSTSKQSSSGYPYSSTWCDAVTPDRSTANAIAEKRLSKTINASRIDTLSSKSNFSIKGYKAPGDTSYRYFLVGYASQSMYGFSSGVYAVNSFGLATYYQYIEQYMYSATNYNYYASVYVFAPMRTADEFNLTIQSMTDVSRINYIEDLEYSPLWTYDEEKHWHESTSSYGDFRSGEAPHNFEDTIIEPSFETGGFTNHKCTECGYEFNDTFTDPLNHSYSDDWTYDEENHWHDCLDEGYEGVEFLAKGPHTFDDWIIDTEPLPDVEGAKHRVCSVCGYREDAVIDALPHVHTYSDEWSADATSHWHAATCAHTEEKADVAAHDWDAVVTPPTLKEGGYTTYTCKVCGYQYVSDETPAWIDQDKGDFTFGGYNDTLLTVQVTGYTGSATSVYIPESVEKDGKTYMVNSLGNSVFRNHGSQITTLYFPKGLSFMNYDSLLGLSSLTTINIDPENTSYYYDGDILYKDSKTTIEFIRPNFTGDLHIPEGVTVVRNYASTSSHNFKDVYLPSTLKSGSTGLPSSGEEMLDNCERFIVAEGNPNWKAYDGMLFNSSLTTLEVVPEHIHDDPQFPDTMTAMGDYFRYVDTGITRVDLSNTALTTLPTYCFYNQKTLTEVLLPDTLTSIPSNAFYQCSGITSLTIPDGVTTLGNQALRSMTGLTTLHLPTALAEDGISWGALSDLTSLATITLSSSCEHHAVVGNILYNKAETEIELVPGGIESIAVPDTITSITMYTFKDCAKVTSVDLGDGITAIPDQAFFNCVNLETLHIGKAVATIGDNITSSNCKKFRSITVDAENPNFTAVEGALYNKDVTELVHVPMGYRGLFDIPDTVTGVAGDTNPFNYRNQICGIRIPASAASWFQTYDWSVYRHSWVYDMHGLHFIISGIGSDVIADTYLHDVPIITNPLFDEYNVDANGFIFADTAKTILVGYAGTETDVVIPSTVVKIDAYCFAYNDDITSITFNEGLLTIEDQAFQGCDSLTELVFPTTLTSLGDSAVSGNKIQRVVFQSTLTEVGYMSLYGCYYIAELTLPDITDEAFSKNSFGSFIWISAGTKLTSLSFAGTMDRWEELKARSDFYKFVEGAEAGLAQISYIQCSDGKILNPFTNPVREAF